ncbi:flagellar biosynthesis protein FliS [Gracilibacillus boraciitolerans JCM 21714]|uniref:Flagellar secretion chaperone FliS n=1 Tax=Gracilibacillus boraciitolerans JCM 21714 TaxID=1298598 RepID=W4VPP6_9BACI|nr:flagellar export chaperone FliS [Gracilibacillus boraciitolerans]GAE95177.1 flagellar biosynthesis protein FliS [Gracilibacillus boraciitolerans JCM 21714]
MAFQQYQAYQNNSVNTASPGELTLMLYNGCLKFIKQANKAIEDKDYETKNEMIKKTQNIVRELMITLDQEAAITKEIMPLYDFVNHALMQANIKNNVDQLEQARAIIQDFRDTWKEVIKQERIRQHGQGVKA